MFSVDPKQLQAAKEIGKHVSARIEMDSANNSFKLTFTPLDDQGAQYIQDLLSKMASGMAAQLNAFFGIKGKMSGK